MGDGLCHPEEVQSFTATLEGSKTRSERSLHAVLANGIVPRLVETANARKRAQEKAAALEAMPKKRSSRLQVRIRAPAPPVRQLKVTKSLTRAWIAPFRTSDSLIVAT